MGLWKKIIKKILKCIDHDLDMRIADYFYFKKLKRKPPELMWTPSRPNKDARLDAGGLQLKDQLFIFGGYLGYDAVLNVVDVFNLKKEQWSDRFDMPTDMAQSHLGMACDGNRYMYAVSGQLGAHCRPATANCFSLDTKNQTWNKLPPLPEPRYAATVQLWNGRLHAIGGSKPDRNTPATEHWSLGIDSGQAIDLEWKKEPSIPRGGPHRASAVINNRLYVFGGQEGDYIAIPGDPDYKCTGDLTSEVMYSDTYMLKQGEESWERMADMPVKVSHTEFSAVVLKDSILLTGGQFDKDVNTKIIALTDVVQVYDAHSNSWRIAGHLPYRSKSAIAAYYNGCLFITTGQRDRGINNPRPGLYDRRTWKAKFPPIL